MKKYFTSGLLVAITFACGPSEKEQQLLVEAVQYHQQAMELERETIKLLEQIKESTPKLEAKVDSLTRAGADSLANLLRKAISQASEIEKQLVEWGKTVVEVPGYEHDHSHDKEGAHHHHSHERVETTPEQMIAIQKELRDKVEQIKNQAQQLKEKINSY
ncbi:MAG: hypothetical protein RMJ44_08455 [Cytophagales bacterium]|nr:hypothetical protein [Bernardetiaceae bacterium]MDW8211104.1 hypothetical protein [Cytophagales bacterium]